MDLKRINYLVVAALTLSVSLCQLDIQGFAPYMSTLQRKIRRAWVRPKELSPKKAIVVFSILRNGTVENVKVTQSSGSEECDKSATDAIKAAAPFQRLPEECPPSVDIQFTFDSDVNEPGIPSPKPPSK